MGISSSSTFRISSGEATGASLAHRLSQGRAQTPTARSDKYKSRLIWTGNQIEKLKKHQLYFFLFHSCQFIVYIFIHFSCYVFDNIFILRFSNIFSLITEALLGYLVVFVIL